MRKRNYDKFIDKASQILADGDMDRVAELVTGKMSAASGIAAKRISRSSNQVDLDAGFRGKTDFQLAYGHPGNGRFPLLVGEAKHFRTRPRMSRPWYEIAPNHLPELMQSLTGKLPTLAVAFCNYGMKVFRVDTLNGVSTISQSPPGPCYLDFSEPGAWDLAFEFWLEIAVLSVLPKRSTNIQKQAISIKVSDESPPNSRKRSHSKSPQPRNPKRSPSQTLNVKTSTGEIVKFRSINLEETLTRKELGSLQDTFEREEREAEEREEARFQMEFDRKPMDADDLSTAEASTPPWERKQI